MDFKGFSSEKEEQRYFDITQKINHFITDVKADEIYNAMKDSEYSKEYAVQRVKELFEEAMNAEKEDFIRSLEDELEEEKELNRVLSERNLDLDSELAGVKEELQKVLEKIKTCLKENEELKAANKEQEFIIKGFEEKGAKGLEQSLTEISKVKEELEFSKSQTLKFKKDVENLTRDNTVAKIKENEFKKDHGDLVEHIRGLQNDKECLETEIEKLSRDSFELKKTLSEISSQNSVLVSDLRSLEEKLKEEIEKNQEETEQILRTFKEKSRKFKSKIIEQKQKIEEISGNQENMKRGFEGKVRDLEDLVKEKNYKISEMEILAEKQNLIHSKLEAERRQFEQLQNAKFSSIQKEVEVQVKRCQDYENQIKHLTDSTLFDLANKKKELEIKKEELAGQLKSALDSLESLRAAYSDQLEISQQVEQENRKLKDLSYQYEDFLEKNAKTIQSFEEKLMVEQEKYSELFNINKQLEQHLKSAEENEWKLQQELDLAKKFSKSLELDLELSLKESRNSQRENSKVCDLIEKMRALETHAKGLKKDNLKWKNSGLAKRVKDLQYYSRDVRSCFLSNLMALQTFINGLFERLSYKIIEKVGENRKIRSDYVLLKKENLSLTQSVSVCSKEMDSLGKEIFEKQKHFKETFKQVKNSLKEKYRSKVLSLEGALQDLAREKTEIRKEADNKIKILQDEIIFYQSKGRDINDLLKKNNGFKDELGVMEKRIFELEVFLEAERTQKDQVVSLKNKEIDELRSKIRQLSKQSG